MTGHEHRYAVQLTWSGSTGAGYEAYGRTHDVQIGEHSWQGSADAAFRGDPGLPNPEELLVAAASACQLLSFLAVAARARIDVVDYRDAASAVMPEGNRPMRITRIDLRPQITIRVVDREVTPQRLHHLSDLAHAECFIAASLTSEVVVFPTFEVLRTSRPAKS